MQSIQTMQAITSVLTREDFMPPVSMTRGGSCNAEDKPSFKAGLEGLRDAALCKKKQNKEWNRISLAEREKMFYDGEMAWQHHYDSTRGKSVEAQHFEAKEEQKIAADETNKDDCIGVPRSIDMLMGRKSLLSLLSMTG